jgi:hypothetical protein
VSSEDSTNQILVDLHAEGMSDLLGDSHIAETRVAPLHLDDGRDEFRRRTFGTRFAAMRRRGKEQPVFPIHQGLVELEQRCRLDERAKLRNPARIHEQRDQSEHKAIERRQIRRSLPRPVADQKLMFQSGNKDYANNCGPQDAGQTGTPSGSRLECSGNLPWDQLPQNGILPIAERIPFTISCLNCAWPGKFEPSVKAPVSWPSDVTHERPPS